MDDFLIRAALAGIGVALAAAPLGCFIVWRRMAYFGDATSHAAILGVALALLLSLPVFIGVVAVALVMAVIVALLQNRGYAMDTLLGVIAHSALAFGLVAVSMLPGVRVDLTAYLFGDILSVTYDGLAIIWVGAAFIAALVAWRWQRLLTTTINPDLAVASGINPRTEQLVLTIALALVVAVAIKVVGALLITAMLIIPAATARAFGKTPESMVGYTALVGCIAVLAGVNTSVWLDSPTGPSIVCVAALLFAGSTLWRLIKPTDTKNA